MPLIEVRNIIKEYKEAHALRGIDLTIEKGQWVSIIGPSGSGKSTLLNLIGGLDSPSSGDVVVDGRNIAGLAEDDLAVFRRETVGFGSPVRVAIS